tara:strand:- start:6276 stop:9188 length:2913 start_codon:yes stop_codon:yes gene_type:complete
MSAGDFLILKNSADTSVLGTAGSTLDALWDSEVINEGVAASYSAGTFTLTNTAPYLIMYSERFYTSDTTNNSRIEGQGRIRMDGFDITEGACEGYIRKSGGQQTMVINGVGIYNATAGDTFTTRFYRGDTATAGTVNRVGGFGGVQILELSSADSFARYSTTTTNALSSTESNVSNWTNSQEESGFLRNTDTVTIADTGRYFMTMSGSTSQTGTSRIGATVFLERGTTEVTGIRGYSHMRGAEGHQNGALSFAGIIDVTAGDTFTLRSDCDNGGMTLDAGAVWQFWKIPAGNESATMEATNGNMNTDADFAFDTLPYIDTSAFTATAGAASISVDQGTHALMLWNQGKKVIDTTQRAYPVGTPALNGTPIEYAGSGVYGRNAASTGTFAAHGGASILHTLVGGTSVSLQNSVLSVAGTVEVESGHFSLLKLEGLYKTYTYAFPPTISDVDGDNRVGNDQDNVVVSGTIFGETQGTGKVELVQFGDYTGTIINLNVDSWSDVSIQVDMASAALSDTYSYLFVTSDTGASAARLLQVGLPPETYTEAVFNMSLQPSHIWRFQNSYADDVGAATANASSGGTPTFDNTVIVKGDTHSLLFNSETDRVSPDNQTDMNIGARSRRYIGGWFMLDRISQTLSVIWEEGAQINNMALLNGFGNNAMFQIADAVDDYVQLYLDVSLTPNRPYHFLANFNGNTYNGGVCRAYLDGVLQSRSDGNPWEQPVLDSHTGDITWGHSGSEALKVGDDRGVDATTIAFVSPVNCNYAHWHNWTDVSLDAATDVRVTLFEKGALQQVTIASDTQVNMQAAIDAYSGTLFLDYPCSVEISTCTDGDFSLDLTNITFEDRVSIQFRYVGIDTLTLVAIGDTTLNSNKLAVPYGGTINVQTPATLTITGLVVGSEIRIYDNEGGAGMGVELSGVESNLSTSYQYSHVGDINDILIQILTTNFEELVIPFQLNAINQSLSVILTQDDNT